MFLAASLRGESRKLLSGLTESEGRQYAKIMERLQLHFGVEKQVELHQARLLNPSDCWIVIILSGKLILKLEP